MDAVKGLATIDQFMMVANNTVQGQIQDFPRGAKV